MRRMTSFLLTASAACCSLFAAPSALHSQARPASLNPPALGPQAPLKLPPMVERTLPNGLKLVIVEQHELPIVDVVLVIRSGSESDPVGKKGLATLTANMLDEGAGDRDALAIADQIGFLAIRLGTAAGFDRSTVSLHATRNVIDSGMAVMADVALRPTFAEKEFDRLKSERLTALLQENDRGPLIADRAFAAIVFGENNPYGNSTSGLTEAVESFSVSDVRDFWKQRYRPNNATLIMVGDLKVAEAVALATRAYGSWERAPVPLVAASSPPPADRTTIYIVDKPKAAQSSFRIGGVGASRSTRDYYPLQVLNTALGGSFTSRLNQNLRETKAYTYGAGSSFSMRREAGPFVASAEIVAAKTDSALIEFMKELNYVRSGLPAEELANTKRYLQLGYADRFETTSDIANQIAALVPYDLPLSTLDAFDAGIAKVTQADVQRVSRQYIDPAKLAIVIAGDRESIEAKLKATGIGPVEIRDSRGRRIIVP